MQCKGIQYNTIQYNTIQYNAMQCNVMQYIAMQCKYLLATKQSNMPMAIQFSKWKLTEEY